MMEKLRRFMAGRYGTDRLNLVLLILSVVLSVVFGFFRPRWLHFLYLIPLVICVWRTFSRNVEKRRQENIRMMQFFAPADAWFQKKKRRFRNRKTYAYFRCKKCRAEMKVPKGRGKVKITCPKCGCEFVRKT